MQYQRLFDMTAIIIAAEKCCPQSSGFISVNALYKLHSSMETCLPPCLFKCILFWWVSGVPVAATECDQVPLCPFLSRGWDCRLWAVALEVWGWRSEHCYLLFLDIFLSEGWATAVANAQDFSLESFISSCCKHVHNRTAFQCCGCAGFPVFGGGGGGPLFLIRVCWYFLIFKELHCVLQERIALYNVFQPLHRAPPIFVTNSSLNLFITYSSLS